MDSVLPFDETQTKSLGILFAVSLADCTDKVNTMKTFLFLLLVVIIIINFVKRLGCTKGHTCKCTPHFC